MQQKRPIGVCFVEWSGEDNQQVVLDWTEIRDEEDGGGGAAAILNAILYRTHLYQRRDRFRKNVFRQGEMALNTSHHDDNNNSGRPITDARD